MRIWRSPSAAKSVTARRLRPISRWISWVRPLCRPRAASRSVRVKVERGSMPYSAVTQPLPELRKNGGTRSSTVAVHNTWVSPNLARHEPSAYFATPGSRLTGRMVSGARPEGRIFISANNSGRRRYSPRRSASTSPTRLREMTVSIASLCSEQAKSMKKRPTAGDLALDDLEALDVATDLDARARRPRPAVAR